MGKDIFARVRGSERINAVELLGLRERGPRFRHVVLAPTRKSVQAKVAQMGEYKGALEMLYRAVQSISWSRVIVDTSGNPALGQGLQNEPSIDLYALHLVRDPRAVAYSWRSEGNCRWPAGASTTS